MPRGARKATVPAAVRRELAVRYGARGGGHAIAARCAYCGASGSIHWPARRDGRPSGWVHFSGLEIDHVIAEANGGATESSNLVLACQRCNRSKGIKDRPT